MTSKSESTITTRMAAQILGHSGPGRVQQLIRDGRLTSPLTVTQVIEYRDNRGAKGTSSTEDGKKWFKIRLSEDEYKDLEGTYTIENPYEGAKAREAAKMAEAAKALEELGL